MLVSLLAQAFALVSGTEQLVRRDTSCGATPDALPTTVDSAYFPSTTEVRQYVDKICHAGLRLPGGPEHLSVVKYINRELSNIPGLTVTRKEFQLANWQPAENSMYKSGQLRIDDEDVPIAASIAYSLPTNGSFVSGPLLYLPEGADINEYDIKGKILVRDYPFLELPISFFETFDYYATPDAVPEGPDSPRTYTRPFVTPPHEDLLAASLGEAAGYISAFNVSRAALEGYYSGHSGTHWLLPGVFTGAEQLQTLKEAAERNATASIKIDATTDTVTVPRIHAMLPGMSNETIVVATHTDGDTYVQDNGPAALLTLLKYFSSLPIEARAKNIMFAFEASHLAYQLDSDKLLARALDDSYDTDGTAFVVAIEHLGTREIEQSPAPDGVGNVLNYTGRGEAILWSVGEVQPVIDGVIDIVKKRGLDNTLVAPGFPPANPPGRVPTYPGMGGLGSYYTTALLPTMALISGPWSLWAPSFGAETLDYERLRLQHIAIGDAILGLMQYSKEELAGNYTRFREERDSGRAEVETLNIDSAQFITDPDGVYF